jgi:16S rRNA G1207 methylase RsmC
LSSPVVDIGAGIGTLEMSLLKDKRNNHLDFVLFDIPNTIENAKKVTNSIYA